MDTAEISLIVSALAAAASFAAVVITYRLGLRRFDHERELEDLAGARRVLDDASAAFARTSTALTAVHEHFDLYWTGRGDDGLTFSSDQQRLEKARTEMDGESARLGLRFGSDHELVDGYSAAETLALEVAYRIDMADREGADDDTAERVKRAIREFTLARESFTLVAYRVVAVKLPAKQLTDV